MAPTARAPLHPPRTMPAPCCVPRWPDAGAPEGECPPPPARPTPTPIQPGGAQTRPRRARPLNRSLLSGASALVRARPGAGLRATFVRFRATTFDGKSRTPRRQQGIAHESGIATFPARVRAKPDFLIFLGNRSGTRTRPSFPWLGCVLICTDFN